VAIVLLLAVVAVLVRTLARAVHRARATSAGPGEERGRLDMEVRRLEETIRRRDEELAQARRAWRTQRDWSRELRARLGRLEHEHDGLEGRGDVRDLVLQAAIDLTEADRGLLLSREDADDDGDLDLVLSRGFEHDPRHSAVAQRFAREVIERDQILREDAPPSDGPDRTPADEEIDSLVAIPVYLRDRFHGVVVCANRPGGFEEVGDDVLLALGDHAGAALHHGLVRQQLRDAHRSAVRILVEAMAAGDPVLHRESSRLVVFALHLARELALEEHDRDVLLCAVLLRAVGHLALPDDVLLKPGPLTPEERALVELHPRIGFNVIDQAPVLRDVATAVLYHHERYDGSGYPAGLAGREIPVASRALAVLEAYGAMTHQRPFRAPRSPEEACQALIEGAGSQFDPEMVHLFVEDVRLAPRPPSDALAEIVLEALPFDPVAAADAMLGPLGASSTDGLTLLGDHRALQQGVRECVHQATAGRPFGLVLVQLEDLPRINDDGSFLVGDRVLHVAARSAKRAAARLGGTAYRASGRRLAILVPLPEDAPPEHAAEEVAMEFAGGPRIRQAVVAWEPGERGEELIARARRTLETAGASAEG
jgi:GGDEF domain-containing protein